MTDHYFLSELQTKNHKIFHKSTKEQKIKILERRLDNLNSNYEYEKDRIERAIEFWKKN